MSATVILTVGLLILSNIFMTFAWYGHLKNLKGSPLWIAIAVSWSIAFFEYVLQVPANRIGHDVLKVNQLKILQEIITLAVFIPFSLFYLKEKLTFNYVIAGFFMVLAAYFMFKK